MNTQPSEVAPFEVTRGTSPVILGFPHTGTHVPDAVKARLNDMGRAVEDTDWHVHRLYDGLLREATCVRATFSRYVIDANRDPEGVSLYPGQNTTTLIPQTDFEGRPIWREGEEPGAEDIAERLAAFHRPYHQAIEAEIARVKAIHGVAILFDCHSIRSRLPYLFEGTLPDLNFGTDGGRTCAPEIEAAATAVVPDGFSQVLNGRFRGGWTTRHYGRPEDGVHAIQLELTQAAYLVAEEVPYDYAPEKAEKLRARLGKILARIEAVASRLAR
ncbi:formiminoglutamase [Breoghania corrubedonensis]|uniref:Formiminoglutamase n=1 Tax=Breoghania corrubedonensis TaxID=665038 RepID=A0A2T5V6D9_9HYPH|nr:N-formylglutamate deformylase [Breoghania corrubedonensis]PTW59323.1 formiminoglutamase [Breoghania corrubedonensis]